MYRGRRGPGAAGDHGPGPRGMAAAGRARRTGLAGPGAAAVSGLAPLHLVVAGRGTGGITRCPGRCPSRWWRFRTAGGLAAAAPGLADRCAGWLAGLAAGQLLGTLAAPPLLRYAPDTGAAGLVLLAEGASVWLADAGTPHRSVDSTRRLAELHGTELLAEAAGVVHRAVQLGTLASAAQLLGAGRALLDSGPACRTAGPVRPPDRQLPGGQASAGRRGHRAGVRPAAAGRGRRHGRGRPCASSGARRDVSAAKVACADAAYRAARTALQVHGAIGYTKEHDLSLWLAKVRALVPAWGSQAYHRAIVLAAVTGRTGGAERQAGGPGSSARSQQRRRCRVMEPTAGIDQNGEQRALRDAVRSLLARHPEQADDQGPGYDPELWRRLCQDIGVAGLAVPERFGGAGAGPVETHIVAEELGRDLTATPLLGSAVLAGKLLLATGDEAACQRLLPGLADGSVLAAVAWAGPAGHWDPADAACTAAAADGGWRLHGEAHYVLHGDSAGLLLVAARTRTASGCSRWTRTRTVSSGRPGSGWI